MSLKKVIIGVGIIGVLGYFLVKKKIDELVTQFATLKILPAGIKNVSLKWNNGQPYASFFLDLRVENPTNKKFVFDGLLAIVKRIAFYDKKNTLLGIAETNITMVSINEYSFVTIPKVPIKIDLKETALSIVSSIQAGGFKPEEITIETTISILGTDYKISQ
jgi:hypothetical protein